MDDDRIAEKVEIVKQVLSEAMGGQEIEYLDPRENHRLDRHLFRTGPRTAEHRLWLGEDFMDDSAVNEMGAALAARNIPTLFAATTERDILLTSTLTAPRIVERLEDRRPSRARTANET